MLFYGMKKPIKQCKNAKIIWANPLINPLEALAKGTPVEGTLAKGTPAKGTPVEGTPVEGTPVEGNITDKYI